LGNSAATYRKRKIKHQFEIIEWCLNELSLRWVDLGERESEPSDGPVKTITVRKEQGLRKTEERQGR